MLDKLFEDYRFLLQRYIDEIWCVDRWINRAVKVRVIAVLLAKWR